MAYVSFLLCFLFVINMMVVPSTARVEVKGCPFDSVYSFGDADSSTSNGLLIADNLASAFHLPYPNPNMEKKAKFDYGINFAAAGSTVMEDLFWEANGIRVGSSNVTLSDQFALFKAHLNSICSSQKMCRERLQRALFFVDTMGSNDYWYQLFQGKTIAEVSRYVPEIVVTIQTTLEKLIAAGATNLLVPGILPLGCQPGYQTLFHSSKNEYDPTQYDSMNCHGALNTLARLHNSHLRQALMELSRQNPDARIVYADYYNAFTAILRHHEFLGFEGKSLMRACCGRGGPYDFDPTKMCNQGSMPVCDDPTKYVHWDGFHLTEEANKLMVDAIVGGKGFTYPQLELPQVNHCAM